ncbi:hypothetical protein BU14_0152s0042 [Porphyra umbilicalis]|uniref:Uncharacterized protein n=1 Tax=Porphyra umbilicalis TaxID=2786 RepID=A0A1X6P941_PORUM|nr:hypothetical protein BU14_0152s0042 [Porphyra umbilicalis]|eukprot:OSX77347.1 hypothetical protein BU14_0152s0042 [Porphyra umbilicalis]
MAGGWWARRDTTRPRPPRGGLGSARRTTTWLAKTHMFREYFQKPSLAQAPSPPRRKSPRNLLFKQPRARPGLGRHHPSGFGVDNDHLGRGGGWSSRLGAFAPPVLASRGQGHLVPLGDGRLVDGNDAGRLDTGRHGLDGAPPPADPALRWFHHRRHGRRHARHVQVLASGGHLLWRRHGRRRRRLGVGRNGRGAAWPPAAARRRRLAAKHKQLPRRARPRNAPLRVDVRHVEHLLGGGRRLAQRHPARRRRRPVRLLDGVARRARPDRPHARAAVAHAEDTPRGGEELLGPRRPPGAVVHAEGGEARAGQPPADARQADGADRRRAVGVDEAPRAEEVGRARRADALAKAGGGLEGRRRVLHGARRKGVAGEAEGVVPRGRAGKDFGERVAGNGRGRRVVGGEHGRRRRGRRRRTPQEGDGGGGRGGSGRLSRRAAGGGTGVPYRGDKRGREETMVESRAEGTNVAIRWDAGGVSGAHGRGRRRDARMVGRSGLGQCDRGRPRRVR